MTALRRVGLGLLVGGALAAPLAWAATRVLGEEVTLLARENDAAEREEARRIRDPRDDITEIYGVTEPGGTVRVMFLDAARRIVPAEDPARVLYVVDRLRGQTPFLARTLLWIGAGVAAVLLVAGAVCVGLGR